ncbi:MAG: hypothetical protein IKG65_07390 [Exiguobacterium sp.]|nr:hypothetical protein [Exiguobacterium sp.]MBR3062217.1 hypothetical protein [Exiguobacterium sp.]MBR3218179.1 hypothetical protein [Exiguobacterium sp.]
MGVKIRRRNPDLLKDIIKHARSIDGKTMRVGVMEDGELGMIAHVHEYGCDIQVTDKMRGYLHSIGIHLKKSTTVIRIPERSFIRAGFNEHESGWRQKASELINEAVTGNVPVDTMFDMLGLELAGKIQEFARDLKSPPNSSATKMLKGSSNPLVDTGRMIGAIKHEVD